MDNKGGGFPWTSLAVLVAFVTSTQLVPHAFDQLRPAEKERAQAVTAADLEVEARLWEDPFVAVRRHESERLERCDKLYKDAAKATDCKLKSVAALRTPKELSRRLMGDDDLDSSETLVLVALVPGNAFVGAEEGRRRTRYAVLAGLQAKGYVPDNAERLGLLQLDESKLSAQPAASDGARPGLLVPYELLSASALSAAVATSSPARPVQAASGVPDIADASRYSQVVLLWVDETALPTRKLDSLALMLHALFEPWVSARQAPPPLAVIGPSTTDALRVALADLRSGAWRHGPGRASRESCALPAGQRPLAQAPSTQDPSLDGYWHLSRALLLSPFSTASDDMLSELGGSSLEDYIAWRFCRLQGGRQDPPVRLIRKISSDKELLAQLTGELSLRLAASKDSPQRVVLIGERDSLYAQALVGQLRAKLSQNPALQLEELYFFRGLDGVTTRDAGRDDGRSGAGAGKSDAQARIEWPEARDQLDYLRRLAQQLQRSEAKVGAVPIGAIGLMASDVHDKLLLLQALHESFADKVFFTTDMDARFLHPRTQTFTRNLLVASSLPLEFPRLPSAHCQAVANRVGLPAPDLAAGNPPWRDVYQSSAYLAARHAGCRSKACRAVEDCAAEEALDRPSLYEVGRSAAVALSGYAFERRPASKPYAVRLVAVALPVLMLLGLLVWPGTPVLRCIKRRWAEAAQDPAGGVLAPSISLPELGFVSLYAWLFFFTLVSLSEMLWPGRLSFAPGMLGLSLGSTLLLLLSLAPEHRFGFRTGLAMAPGAHRVLRGLCWLSLLLLWGLMLRQAAPTPCQNCEPLAWLEGISAWPSHLIHLLALLAIVDTLDATWSRSVHGMAEESAWLRLPEQAPKRAGVAAREGGLRFMRRIWSRHLSVAGWHAPAGGSVDFRILWHQYGRRGSRVPRALRILLGFVLTLAVVLGLFFGFSDGAGPAVPVRGDDHRALIRFTLDAILVLLPLLVVAVGDATMLACRFIRLLTAARTVYPGSTLAYFAASLGSAHEQLWLRPIAADPALRADAPLSLRRHSLLDDWIDVQVVVRRSARIGPLVMGPFVVLTLLIVGRSRLFDNWSLTLPVAMAASAYLLGLLALAVLLKQAAEQARSRALRRMEADLRWLMGGDEDQRKLIEPFKRLMSSVQEERGGALAPIFEQPLVKALLVPLGGAGGAQLFEYFLLAR
ncbi:hypothetical protein LNV23_13910 [Paucibacter sp. DJ1R-11]|uniref:hypothetical protein n=1 Tax=Paucibacter sp. DJ1R-11 TaxID=2893556 RepID=UPI0021E4436A|nr:hypothetical protein [Paucibacter sp. DJ1R-11]MCV2364544.1 hypothetical protein [Paucibacter sp. DJ1R-11]